MNNDKNFSWNDDLNLKPIDKALKQAKQKSDLREIITLSWIRSVFLIISPIIVLSIIIVYLLNLLLPEHYRWLLSNDLTQVKDLFISIVAGIVLSLTTSSFLKTNKN